MSIGGSASKGGGTQTTEPWSEQKPFLIKGLQRAEDWYKSDTPSYYPGNTVAPLSAETSRVGDMLNAKTAFNATLLPGVMSEVAGQAGGSYLGKNPGDSYYSGFASGSNPVSNLNMRTAGGAYLNSNPFLDAMYNSSARSLLTNYGDAMRDTQSAFSRAGRYGNDEAMFNAENRNLETLLRGLGDMGANIYGTNYANERALQEQAMGREGNLRLAGAEGLSTNFNNERGNMLKAASLMPDLIGASYIGSDKMQDYGKYKDEYGQDVLNADISRFDYNQNLPLEKLKQFMGLIQGDYGGTTTSKTKQTSGGFGLNLFR